ncbi:MAG: SDR family oxidoreductase [Myxococcota bacterium]
MTQQSRFENKTVVVTGGNSGIGKAAAQRFVDEGAKVILTGRDRGRVEAAAREVGAEGIVADQADPAAIEGLVSTLRELHGKVDVLFVNAGIFLPTPVGQLDEDAFDRMMGVNFKGAVFTIERFLPLLADGASIVNLSSINAYTGMANTSVYGASKAALNAYMRAAATELAPRKIRVNSVNPGPVSTPIFGKTGMDKESLEGFAAAMQQRIPLKTFGTPEAVAAVVAFLASEEAWYVTGAEWNVDGGINVNPILTA